jgi:hypothetical protein
MRRLPQWAAAALAAATLAGCAAAPSMPAASHSTHATAPSPSPGTATGTSPSAPAQGAAPCRGAGGFSCEMTARIHRVQRYLAGRPGRIGIVLHDRQTGATWRNAGAHTDMPAASTIKLAIVTDLLLRNGSDAIELTGQDWDLIHHALHESSDQAADRLWAAYEDGSFLGRIRRFGMHSAYFTTPGSPYWGFMYCSATDLSHLMNYVLGHIPDGARAYITGQIQHVAPIQQWGVWGAGPENHPGNKDGWEDDGGTWITNTVGFAGPHARYTLAVMYDTRGARGFHYGSTTLSQVAALLFRGHLGPAPTARATP